MLHEVIVVVESQGPIFEDSNMLILLLNLTTKCVDDNCPMMVDIIYYSFLNETYLDLLTLFNSNCVHIIDCAS